jgi:hypothetical protein
MLSLVLGDVDVDVEVDVDVDVDNEANANATERLMGVITESTQTWNRRLLLLIGKNLMDEGFWISEEVNGISQSVTVVSLIFFERLDAFAEDACT